MFAVKFSAPGAASARATVRDLDSGAVRHVSCLRFDPAVNLAPLEAAAGLRGVPLKVLELQRQTAATFYGGGLVLSRPDQHVAWRGNTLPANSLALIDRIQGAASHGSGAGSGHAIAMA
jgi:hypothetical protein